MKLCCGLVVAVLITVVSAQDLSPDDVYTFCKQSSACQGFCETYKTICSIETGICSCASPMTKLKTLTSNYNCKNARPRTRCSNGCKTYAMITPGFRRGETKICESRTENKRMCFCLPKV